MNITAKYTFDVEPLKEFLIGLKQFARESVVVGVLGDDASKIHPDTDITIGEIALINELGTTHIPARPFLANTVNNKSLVLTTLGNAARAFLSGRTSPHEALKVAGEVLANAVRTTLLEGVAPANAQATVDWKGHGDTLIGLTGALYDAISYQIRGG